jgi:osmotically-inducible protein OsmY
MNLFKHHSSSDGRRQSRLSTSVASIAAGALVVFLAGCGDSGTRQVDTADSTTGSQQQSDDTPAQQTASNPDTSTGYGAAGTRPTDAANTHGTPAAQPGAATGSGTLPQQQRVAGSDAQDRATDATVAGKQAMSGDMLDPQGLEQGIRESLRTAQNLGLTEEQLQQVKITVANDTVTLTGTVPSREAGQSIEARVKQHPGVETVQNWLNAQED